MTKYTKYDFDRMRLKELKAYAKKKGIKVSKRTKSQLIKMLLLKQENVTFDVNNIPFYYH